MTVRPTTRTTLRALVFWLATMPLASAPAPAVGPAVAAAPAALPIFRSDSTVIEANERLQWSIPFNVENKFTVGMYLDSLYCEVQDLDPGETHEDRVKRLDISHVVKGNAAGPGESYGFTYVAPAIAEHARLTFRLGISRADKSRTTLTTVVEAMPGPISRAHPSQFLTVSGRRVEYLLFPAAKDTAPGLLLVHGRGQNARSLMRMALRFAPIGYTVMLVSMPGYGQSEGPADAVGPPTVLALGAALDQLEATPGVDAKRVGAWGLSSGAAAVTLLAQGRPDVKATVAQSGFYDLWSVYRALKDTSLREAIVRGAGPDSLSWRKRSAALNPGTPTAILILHGEKDVSVPAQQAHGFADALKARGADVETRFFPNSAHELPPGEAMKTAIEFLDRRLGR